MNEVKPLTTDMLQKLFKSGLEIEGFELDSDNNDFIWCGLGYSFLIDIKDWEHYPHLLTRLIEAVNKQEHVMSIIIDPLAIILNRGFTTLEVLKVEDYKSIDNCKESVIIKYLEITNE